MADLTVPLPLLAMLLFRMIGPISLLPLFARATAGADRRMQFQIALLAALVALGALTLAIFVGVAVMQSAGTSRPSLIIAAGIILTLSALPGILGVTLTRRAQPAPPAHGLAVTPIAIPGIVTPTGVAILIIFSSYFTSTGDRIAMFTVTAAVMMTNFLAMLSAQWFMRVVGPTPLIILGAIFGVLQVAMGVEMIVSGLRLSTLSSGS